ncbi:hypothetical protein, partial [Hyphomonas sp.]|uniref:hypothetical protein n=1 Tax=Hyphomonas sp. TaxID=87 RepID=UPI003298AC37
YIKNYCCSTSFTETEKKHRHSDTLRLELQLVRAYPLAAMTRKNFIRAACDSLEIASPLTKRLDLDLEMLPGSEMVEIWGAKKNTESNPQMKVCTPPADSHSSSQDTAARELEECS